jgi:recombination protein RecT
MAIEATGNTKLHTAAPRAMSGQEKKFDTVKKLLAANLPAIASVLPKHITKERLARITMTALQKTPKLLDCTPESFISCVLTCAALGLEPDGTLGQAYLIPYGTTCTLVPGYKGLIKLARNSGEIASIDAHEVAAGDLFEYEYGSNPRIKHVPAECPIIEVEGVKQLDPSWRPGVVTHFYAIARMKDGTEQFTVMQSWEVNEIRDGSKNGKAGPWVDHYVEMGKKTAIRRASKMWPMSVEVQRLLAADEGLDRGVVPTMGDIIDVEMVSVPTEPEDKPEEGKRTPITTTTEGSK